MATDPTATWPATGAAPTLSLERKAVGPLCLGDSFEKAKPLGRPARVHGSDCVQLYAEGYA